MKRGGNRHSLTKQRHPKASGRKLISALNGGDMEFLDISKKEKVRGSSLLGRASYEDGEMMGGGSEGEDEFRLSSVSSSTRFKLNGKALDECNAVDPATVPRRLRSAMKRNHESVSPPLPDGKKSNCAIIGTESPHVNGVKRPKLHTKIGGSDKSPKQIVHNAITKDEEEVVEALYALASIVNKPAKSKVYRRAAKGAVPSPFPETKMSSVPPSEALKEESTKSPNVLAAVEAAKPTLYKEESSAETVNDEPVKGPTVSEKPASFGGQKFKLELNDTAQKDVQGISLLSKDERHTQLNDAVTSFTPLEVPSELYPGNGLLETIQPKSLSVRRLESVPLHDVAVATQREAKPVMENVEICTRLQEGVSDLQHTMPKGLSDGRWHLTRTSSTKAGACQDSASCASRPASTGNDVSNEKIALVSVGRKQSLKRCASHVYISRFIRAYQRMEKKSSWSPSANQSKLNEGIKSGITASNNPTVLKTGLSNGMSVAADGFVANRNLHEARIGTLKESRLVQDKQASTSSGIYPEQKQSCDFLSLAAGRESSRNPGLEYSAQIHVPCLQSLVQHPIMPFSFPHPHYTAPCPGQLAAAAQQMQEQLPQSSGNPYVGPPLGHGSSAKQQHQEQQLWAAQMAHHNRPSNPSSSHLPKWQNGRHDVPSLVPYSQGIVHPSSSLEVLGPKYMSSPQKFFAISSSSPSSRGKRQHHDQSSSCDEAVTGFRPNGAPHLQQLLCNAQNM